MLHDSSLSFSQTVPKSALSLSSVLAFGHREAHFRSDLSCKQMRGAGRTPRAVMEPSGGSTADKVAAS